MSLLADADAIASVLHERAFLVLTGAGCSTESGIPDYRGEGTRARARNPVKIDTFLRDPHARRRYWARSFFGWPRFANAKPNPAHEALAAMQMAVVTQNVDGLHQAAGSGDVIELHGTLAHVRCAQCGTKRARADVQRDLVTRNPRLAGEVELAPDGDADIDERLIAAFECVDCETCGGFFRPDVVFFGESVPRACVEDAYARVAACGPLLVVGTSLAVFSGYRFVRRASELDKTIVLVNVGPSRGDPHATLKIEARAGEILPLVAERLGHSANKRSSSAA